MKIRSNLTLRKLGSDYLVVDPDQGQVDLTRVFSFNSSAAFLIESLKGKDFNLKAAAQILQDEFDIDEEMALSDARAILLQLKDHHLVLD